MFINLVGNVVFRLSIPLASAAINPQHAVSQAMGSSSLTIAGSFAVYLTITID